MCIKNYFAEQDMTHTHGRARSAPTQRCSRLETKRDFTLFKSPHTVPSKPALPSGDKKPCRRRFLYNFEF